MAKAKRQNEQLPLVKDYLIKSPDQFKKELLDRLNIGDRILAKNVATANDLGELLEEFYSWDNYNAELLKQSFDNPQNSFFKEYTYVGISIGTSGPVYFSDQVKEASGRIQNKYQRLKRIYEKIGLMPVSADFEIVEIEESKDIKALRLLENLLNKFHKVAQTIRQRHGGRETIIVKDEYDVQDLLRGLLKIYFEDV